MIGLAELGIDAVDTVILALPPPSQGKDKTMDKIQNLWKVRQNYCFLLLILIFYSVLYVIPFFIRV